MLAKKKAQKKKAVEPKPGPKSEEISVSATEEKPRREGLLAAFNTLSGVAPGSMGDGSEHRTAWSYHLLGMIDLWLRKLQTGGPGARGLTLKRDVIDMDIIHRQRLNAERAEKPATGEATTQTEQILTTEAHIP